MEVISSAMSSFEVDCIFPSIACAGSGLAWVRTDEKRLQLVDKDFTVKDAVNTDFHFDDIALTPQGETLLSDFEGRCIKLISKDKTIQTLFETEWDPCGICCSESGDVIVAFPYVEGNGRVVKYSRTGEKIHEFDHSIFWESYRISASRFNNDIFVCDRDSSQPALFDLDQSYNFRYRYTASGDEKFDPIEVCTDKIGNVIVSDTDNDRIHVLNKDGKFLRYLFPSDNDSCIAGTVDVDDDGNLWIGQRHKGDDSDEICNEGRVTVVKFGKEIANIK